MGSVMLAVTECIMMLQAMFYSWSYLKKKGVLYCLYYLYLTGSKYI